MYFYMLFLRVKLNDQNKYIKNKGDIRWEVEE